MMSNEIFVPTPTVVFVDDAPWECFFHLAVVLRKAGIRTVRVSVGRPRWHLDNILFDRHVSLRCPPAPEELVEILWNEYVTDVQPTESLAVTTYTALSLLPASHRSDIWFGRPTLLDKWEVANVLRDFGVQTPDTLLAETTSTLEAVEHFSLPIVIKRRVSSSGAGVEVFTSLESLDKFVKAIKLPNEWFFERFAQGRSIACAFCVSDKGIDVIATYEILERVNSWGSSTVVEVVADSKITELAISLATATHIRGLVCFDIIRDSEGVDWIHDINPRAFGTLLTFQNGGFDFCGSYIRCLTGRGDVGNSPASVHGETAFVFPYGLAEIIRSRPLGGVWLRTYRWIRPYWRLLGPSYFLSLIIRGPTMTARKKWGRARFRQSA